MVKMTLREPNVLIQRASHGGCDAWDVFAVSEGAAGVMLECVHSTSVTMGAGNDGRAVATITVECVIDDNRCGTKS